MLRFLVIADSHIRPTDQEVGSYPSNALLVRRNEFIVDLCNQVGPAFVVHLGDIVHPLPIEHSHEVALQLARAVYADLDAPIHFVPGNHDVGDKPNAHVGVPPVAEENYAPFESTWGPAYASFDVGVCHFVRIDAQAMNSGLEREHDQRAWLEADLATARTADQRIFLFTHYPPFVRDRNENEHYDNIGEPARSWFLGLLESFKVEAVFCGHVHNFQYNTHGNTDLYVAPSTGFARPDYAELGAVAPVDEYGRDDRAKLGVLVVDVHKTGHDILPLRSFGTTSAATALPVHLPSFLDPGWRNILGVTLRHSWTSITDFPTAGLDEFARKRIRNDATLLALWEARITRVRIPLDDLKTADVLQRVAALSNRGMRFTAFSAGVPTAADLDAIHLAGHIVDTWEIAAFAAEIVEVAGAIDIDGIHVEHAIAPIVPIGANPTSVHHFVSAGFDPAKTGLIEEFTSLDAAGAFSRLVFRIADGSNIENGVSRATAVSTRLGRHPIVIVELPRAGESRMFSDDDAVAKRVVEAARAGMTRPDCQIVLDGFMDHDRGYYPRHGLIDRRYNPRPAFYALIAELSRHK